MQTFAEQPLAAPAAFVSDGLGCFKAVPGMGILHEPHDTGCDAASAKHPSFLAVNTALGNIKTSLSGTYRAVGFRKYAHRGGRQLSGPSAVPVQPPVRSARGSRTLGEGLVVSSVLPPFVQFARLNRLADQDGASAHRKTQAVALPGRCTLRATGALEAIRCAANGAVLLAGNASTNVLDRPAHRARVGQMNRFNRRSAAC